VKSSCRKIVDDAWVASRIAGLEADIRQQGTYEELAAQEEPFAEMARRQMV
jgi:hypothetical protein